MNKEVAIISLVANRRLSDDCDNFLLLSSHWKIRFRFLEHFLEGGVALFAQQGEVTFINYSGGSQEAKYHNMHK